MTAKKTVQSVGKYKENVSKNRMTARKTGGIVYTKYNELKKGKVYNMHYLKKHLPPFKNNLHTKKPKYNDINNLQTVSGWIKTGQSYPKSLQQDKKIKALAKMMAQSQKGKKVIEDGNSIKKLCIEKYGSKIGLQKYKNLTKPDFTRSGSPQTSHLSNVLESNGKVAEKVNRYGLRYYDNLSGIESVSSTDSYESRQTKSRLNIDGKVAKNVNGYGLKDYDNLSGFESVSSTVSSSF